MARQETSSPDRILTAARLLWAALVAGISMFGVMVTILVRQAHNPPLPQSNPRLFLWIGLGLLAVTTPLGYFLRSQIYKRHWENAAVQPQGYFKGNLLLWALCEGPAFLGLTGALLNQSLWPTGLVTLLAVLVLLINFPTGGPLRPAHNPYQS